VPQKRPAGILDPLKVFMSETSETVVFVYFHCREGLDMPVQSFEELPIPGITTGMNRDRSTVKAVIFDMDNTLFDFVEAKMRACRKVAEFTGSEDGMELFRYFLRQAGGFEDMDCIADYLNDRGIHDEDIHGRCYEIYGKTELENIETYEGVEETLEFLKREGFKLAIVTNADRKNLNARLQEADLSGFFDVTVTREATGKLKPDHRPILSALHELGVEPREALKVGDSLARDISPARRIGMKTAYAKYGDRNPHNEDGPKADFTLEEVRDLIGLLKPEKSEEVDR
jgi:putative hydrolase of the HAD superfamily